MVSYKSDLNIKLKYYGDKQDIEIGIDEDEYDDTKTMSGYNDPNLEQDTVMDLNTIRGD